MIVTKARRHVLFQRLVTNHQSAAPGKEDESDGQNSDDKQPGFDEISEVVDNDTIYRDGGRFLMIYKSQDLIHSKDTNSHEHLPYHVHCQRSSATSSWMGAIVIM